MKQKKYPELLMESSQSKLSSIFGIFAAGSDISNQSLISPNNLLENTMNLNQFHEIQFILLRNYNLFGFENKFCSAPINSLIKRRKCV